MKTKGLFQAIVISSVLMFSGATLASPLDEVFQPAQHECFIIGLLDNDENHGFDFDFVIPVGGPSRGSHGGSNRVFEYKDHKVVVVADGKWMGITWWKGAQKLGEAVTVTTNAEILSRVLIVVNTTNDNERVSLTCGFEGAQQP